ncbi:MAG: exonuclease domain-containing protein [Proteobacteria bacterium]|nr:exonuclease domain-containing protein [Pseudomonadota bacterium]
MAIVDLETTGLPNDPGARILEFAALLLDPGESKLRAVATLIHPEVPIPPAIQRLTGISDAMVSDAPPLETVRDALREQLCGRTIVAHNADFERHFLARWIGGELANSIYLDTQDLLAVAHPDAPDLRLESFTRSMFGTEERHRALDDASDTLRVMARIAFGAHAGEPRYAAARAALSKYAPDSPWLALLESERDARNAPESRAFVEIGASDEPVVEFDEAAIAASLRDAARGARHFPGYRVREAQVELALRFARVIGHGGRVLVEGGTGVGKSLAYLGAAIPFAMREAERAKEAGVRARPVVISTRTKLLQDQLLSKDIPAAARFLGYPSLRAVSIKGVLAACASIRPHGELGSMPAAWLRRHPPLLDLLRRSVATRAEQCTREQCAMHAHCAFGRRRAALAQAHLVVANHDLLLRWPPDYPAFAHAIVDEAHELSDVADEVYALTVRPDEVLERIDDVFGRPAPDSRHSAAPHYAGGMLPATKSRALRKDALAWRRAVQQELVALGRSLESLASEFGEVQVPEHAGPHFEAAAHCAEIAALRIDEVSREMEAAVDPEESAGGIARNATELRGAASALRLAFQGSADSVASFDGIDAPWDSWRLSVRLVSPAAAFRENFLERLESFAGVSASLFVGGDAFAALGEVGVTGGATEVETLSVPSPFPYEKHMRVAALSGGADLVRETVDVLEVLARHLGGRTLGLFTSLRRMNDVAALLAERLRDDGIEVLAPRRASDDPSALVERFRQGGAVLLGARKFWQGLDLPGEQLQAVVIEKLPFEVPTELRRRRELRLKREGIDAFERFALGKMLLNLKQMVGRLIRSEEDRGIVVLVESRPEKRYFRRLGDALPPGSRVVLAEPEDLVTLLTEVGIGAADGC